MLQLPPPVESTSLRQYVIFAAIILASNIITLLATRYANRRQSAQELHESEARVHESSARFGLAQAQTAQTLAETVEQVSAQLRDVLGNEKHKDSYIQLLELQNERARRAGYLDEDRKPGTESGNPAAMPPAS